MMPSMGDAEPDSLKHIYARLGSSRLLLDDMRRSKSAEAAVKAASRSQAEALAVALRALSKKVISNPDNKANLISAIFKSGLHECDVTALIAEVDSNDGKVNVGSGRKEWQMKPYGAVINSH